MTADPLPPEVAAHLADRLEEDGFAYALGGALALGAWGIPRMTSDVDVSVFATLDELDKVLDVVERAGAMVDRVEAGRSALRAGFFVAFFGRTRIDVFMAHHPWHEQMKRKRVLLSTPNGKRWFLSLDDTVLAKLLYARPKDVQDLERLFAVQRDRIDAQYLLEWLPRLVPAADRRLDLLGRLLAEPADT